MRTTMLVIVLSSAAACMPLGAEREHEFGSPDAGVDGNSASTTCTNVEVKYGDVSIATAAGMANLPTSCWRLQGKLTIAGSAITNLDKLGDLRSVTDLEINGTGLQKFGSKGPVEVAGHVSIRDNASLTDVSNIKLASEIQSLRIENNGVLTALGNLGKFTKAYDQVTIYGNAKLASVDLSTAQVLNAGVFIQQNALLTTITLTALQSVGNVNISRNPALTSIGTMNALTYLHGSLTIDDNDALQTLGTLADGLFVDLGVIITNNGALRDVGSLEYADRILGPVNISNNPQLSTTQAHDVGCCVMTGGFAASGNSGSCNSNHYCLDFQNCYR
jgi:hypothetical protein